MSSRRFGPILLLISVGAFIPIYACSDDDAENGADAGSGDASPNEANAPTGDSSSGPVADSSPTDSSPVDSSPVDSSTHDASTHDADASTIDSSTVDAHADADADAATLDSGKCTDLVNGASEVTPTANPATLPAAAGGVIADGTYFMTSEVEYQQAAPQDPKKQNTFRIKGSRFDIFFHEVGEDDLIGSGTITVLSATKLRLDFDCPAAFGQLPIEYTATPTTFSYYTTGNHDLSTFAKQ